MSRMMKMKMKDFKIGKKLVVAFGAIIILFIATVLSAILGITKLSSNFNRFYYESYALTKYSADMKYAFQSAQKYILVAITSRDSKSIQANLELSQQQLATIADNMEQFGEVITDGELMAEYKAIMDSSIPIKEEIFECLKSNHNDSALIKFELSYSPLLQRAQDKLDEIGEVISQNADSFYQKGIEAQRNAFLLFIALTVISLAATFSFCIYIIRSITKPLQEIETAADKMSVGDMNAVITYQSKDELGTLADSMREMMATWHTYIDNISEARKAMVTEFGAT